MKKLLLILLTIWACAVAQAQRHDWTITGRDYFTNTGFLVDSFPTTLPKLVADILPYGSDTTYAAFVYAKLGTNLLRQHHLVGILPIKLNGSLGKVEYSFLPDSLTVNSPFANLPGSIISRSRRILTDQIEEIRATDTSVYSVLRFQTRSLTDYSVTSSARFNLGLRSGGFTDMVKIDSLLLFSYILDTLVSNQRQNSRLGFAKYNLTSSSLADYNMGLSNVFGHKDSGFYYREVKLTPSNSRSSIIHSYRYTKNTDSLYLYETDYQGHQTYIYSKHYSKFDRYSSYGLSVGGTRSGTTQNVPLTHYFEQRYLLGRTVRNAPDSSAISVLDKNLQLIKNIKIPGCIVYMKPLQNRNIFVTYSTKRKGYTFFTTDSLFYASVFDTLGNELFRHEIHEASLYNNTFKFGVTNYPVAYTEDHKGGLFILCYARTATIVHLSGIGKFYQDTVRPGPVVGLATVITSSKPTFYPNPTTGQLRSNLPNLLPVKVYNLMGQEVLTGEISHDQPLDMSSLGRGVYVVRWAGGSGQNYAKVVRE